MRRRIGDRSAGGSVSIPSQLDRARTRFSTKIGSITNQQCRVEPRPMKTDLKVGFQAAVCNAMDAMHAGHAMQIKKLQCTQCMHRKNATDARIESVACVAFFAYVSCVFCFSFDCVASRASIALHMLHTTAWKLHVVSL